MQFPKWLGFPGSVTRTLPFLTALGVLCGLANRIGAQGDHWYGQTHTFCQFVSLPPARVQPQIVVVQFFTQGALRADGANLTVYDGRHRSLPCRVLQVGPGDLCRIAFQTVRAESTYRIYFGGPVPEKKPPSWDNPAGLVLETRRWKSCNLKSLPSVRRALEASTLSGKDYVSNVFHAYDPFSPGTEPFLSHYQGQLRIDHPGKYQFFTSSQDCSFLLIDGKQVVAAPGAHRAVRSARFKGEITLTAGPHQFEYVHAAAGSSACMVAAWQPPGSSKPEVIPPRAFGSDTIAHVPAGALWHKTNGRIPAFAVEARGEVPLAGSEKPLVRVQFKDVSARGVTDRARVRWDFGDGYTTEVKEPLHIYLSPGLYTVKMTVQGRSRTLETVNRVPITRPVLFPDPKRRPDKLTSYRRILDKHDPKKLKFENVLQLVRAYEQLGEIPTAAATGRAALLSDRRPEEDTALEDLVSVVGPLFRDRLDDPKGALSVWQAAAKAIRREDGKLRCEAEAADILLHDLLRPREAKVPLDSATGRLNKSSDPTLARRLYRVWGDWYARGGDRKAARQAYARASTFRSSPGDVVKDSARRGAFSRSIEAYLRTKDLDRAREELRHWQDEFPADKLEGYLPLLQARYRVAREKYPQAIAVATDLLTINPESPYADRLVYLAAECEEKLGRTERALADYRALLTDYPGSLLVKKAKEKLSRSVVDPPKDPPRKGKKER